MDLIRDRPNSLEAELLEVKGHLASTSPVSDSDTYPVQMRAFVDEAESAIQTLKKRSLEVLLHVQRLQAYLGEGVRVPRPPDPPSSAFTSPSRDIRARIPLRCDHPQGEEEEPHKPPSSQQRGPNAAVKSDPR